MLSSDGRFTFVPAHAELRISTWADGIPQALRENEVRFIRLEPGAMDTLPRLAALAPPIIRLDIEGEPAEAASVTAFSKLKQLAIRGPVDAIDFSKLGHLEEVLLTLDERRFGNLSAAPSLKQLTINDGDVRDLTPFVEMRGLEHLSLGGSALRSLSGLGRLPKLKELALDSVPLEDLAGLEEARSIEKVILYSLPRLKSIRQLGALPNLRELRMTQLRSLEDVDTLGSCSSLERLHLTLKVAPSGPALSRLKKVTHLLLVSDQPVPSLQFLRDMPSLEGLSLEKTVVTDGDMSPLKDHPRLLRAGYLEKKHYRPRQKEVIDEKGMVLHGR